jgi:hypothetical protein
MGPTNRLLTKAHALHPSCGWVPGGGVHSLQRASSTPGPIFGGCPASGIHPTRTGDAAVHLDLLEQPEEYAFFSTPLEC